MRRCQRCGHGYRGEPPYCDACEEYTHMVQHEISEVQCSHCGLMMMPGAFDRHRWTIYYRNGEKPTGKRVPKWWA